MLFAGTADDAEEIAALAGIPAVEVVRSPVFDHAATGLARATDLARAIAFGLDGRRRRRIQASQDRPGVQNPRASSAGACRSRRSPGFRISSTACFRIFSPGAPIGGVISAFGSRLRPAATSC